MARCAPRGRGRARRHAHRARGVRTRRPSAAGTTGAHRVCSRSSTSPRRSTRRRRAVKAQVTGPLTLGVALVDAGVDARTRAFRRAAVATRAWAVAMEELVEHALPDAGLVLFFDEPALVPVATRQRPARSRSGDRRAVGRAGGRRVHDRRPRVRRRRPRARARSRPADRRDRSAGTSWCSDAVPIARFLDGDGWVAWGAVPTDRPVGESADPHWRRLAEVWCELTRRGCDPVPLRTRGMITPACGLAGYGATQAERVLGIARELAARVHDQAVAARLMLGA